MATDIIIGKRKLDVVVVDFETYYAKDYSLRLTRYNMTTYIRDPQFLAQGVGIIKNGIYHWFTGNDIAAALRSIDWSRTAMFAHNALFEAAILAERYNIFPAFHVDTAAMSRLYWGMSYKHDLDSLAKRHNLPGKVLKSKLDDVKGIREPSPEQLEKLGQYCEGDCRDTLGVFLAMYHAVPDNELKLIDLTTRLFSRSPLLVDHAIANEELEYQINHKEYLIGNTSVTKDELMSNQKLAELLHQLGVEPPMKVSPRTGKATFAFAANDGGFQLLLEHDNPLVVAVAEARIAVKSTQAETRAARLIACSQPGYTLPVALTYAGAKTHRWAGTNKLNLQNLPRFTYLPNGKVDPNSGRLRRAIMAPENHVIVVCDLSQIEVRVLAWWAGQLDILSDFANSVDLYKKMAARTFGIPIEEVTKIQRFVGKVLILGLGYGMGANKLAITLTSGAMGVAVETTVAEAQVYVNTYRNTYVMITQAWRWGEQLLKVLAFGGDITIHKVRAIKNMLIFPNGTWIRYKGMHWNGEEKSFMYWGRTGMTRIYGALLVENIIQKLARDVIGEHLIAIDEEIDYAQVVMTTHDEIGAVTHEDNAEKTFNSMSSIMTRCPDWLDGVVLNNEGGWAREYSK